MTKEEIIIKIEEIGIEEFLYEDYDKEALPPNEEVYSVGDCEGGGDYAEKVFHFPEQNLYFQFTGFYQSYNGTDWNSTIQEVRPVEKLITVYQ